MADTDTTPTGPDASRGYVPVFGDRVRTVIYILSLIASVVGAGFTAFGDPAIGAYITTAAGILAGGFGVVYNPMRLSAK